MSAPANPIPVRLGDLDETVRALAAEERRSLNAMLTLLVEEALENRGFTGETTKPTRDVDTKPVIREEGGVESGRSRTASPSSRKVMCEHRIPPGAFCSRCDVGAEPVVAGSPSGGEGATTPESAPATPPPGYQPKVFTDNCPWAAGHVQGVYCPACDGDH